MVSFDVISLYTNVTETLVQKAIKANYKHLKTGFSNNFNIPLKILITRNNPIYFPEYICFFQ